MAGPLHLHTFACCQTELLLTASRADCLPGPRPNPVGMVTRHGKAWRGRLTARPISLGESFRETSFSGQTSTHTNDLQMSLNECMLVYSNAETLWTLFNQIVPQPKLVTKSFFCTALFPFPPHVRNHED